jgi:hypothetical protein
MKALTTSARLRHARAALKQAATLLRDAATFGTVDDALRRDMVLRAMDAVDLSVWVSSFRVRASKHLSAVRAAKRRRAA